MASSSHAVAAPDGADPLEIVDVDGDSESDDPSGEEDAPANADDAGPSTSTSNKKKKKKKTSKALKALKNLAPQAKLQEAVYGEVMQRVKAAQPDGGASLNEAEVRAALDQLKVMDVVRGKSGLGGKGKKDMGEHKFWATQPVPRFNDAAPEEDGPIEPSKPRAEVRQEAYPLPKDFEWCAIDMTDEEQTKEVYTLLSLNYVEDDDASFRFNYSAEFLAWALKPPGYNPAWHVGVRVSSNKKLVAFISGVPIKLRVREKTFDASEINFLCVHKKLRSKRLAPVLIKEVTRQVHLTGVFQAIYTGGVVLPTPLATCRYFHRTLNVPKLVDVRFTYVPRNMTLARMIRQYKLPATPRLAGLREMEDKDVPQVAELFKKYLTRYDMAPVWNDEELQHQLLSGRGEGEVKNGRKDKQVTWTYVVADPTTGNITDFFSFYSLPSTVIGSTKYPTLEAAYIYYYASNVAFDGQPELDTRLAKRLQELLGDALIIANEARFDVFNGLTMMDNPQFLTELKFLPGDGMLNFYLYNWRTNPLAGMEARGDTPAGRGVGVAML